jgi:hypothetical protein
MILYRMTLVHASLLVEQIDNEIPDRLNEAAEASVAHNIGIYIQRNLFDVAQQRNRTGHTPSTPAARPLSTLRRPCRRARLVRRVAALEPAAPFRENAILRRRAIPNRLALFIEREEARLADVVEAKVSEARAQPGRFSLYHKICETVL